jgi:hypothetical protein
MARYELQQVGLTAQCSFDHCADIQPRGTHAHFGKYLSAECPAPILFSLARSYDEQTLLNFNNIILFTIEIARYQS